MLSYIDIDAFYCKCFGTVCYTCECEGRELVSFIENVEYSPDPNIIIDDTLRPQVTHTPSEIRPVAGNDGTTLEISYRPGYEPSVTIDLDKPGVPNSSLDVEDIILVGNVKTVDIYYKPTDDSPSWNVETGVSVGINGLVNWPVGERYISVGELKLVPTEATSEDDEYFTFTVQVYGCRERYSKGFL